jgi:hypothetical protein
MLEKISAAATRVPSPTYLVVYGTPNMPVDQWGG